MTTDGFDNAPALVFRRAWQQAMAPALPASERIANPYTYAAVDGRDAR